MHEFQERNTSLLSQQVTGKGKQVLARVRTADDWVRAGARGRLRSRVASVPSCPRLRRILTALGRRSGALASSCLCLHWQTRGAGRHGRRRRLQADAAGVSVACRRSKHVPKRATPAQPHASSAGTVTISSRRALTGAGDLSTSMVVALLACAGGAATAPPAPAAASPTAAAPCSA